MTLLDWLRKILGYVFLSMGVSRPQQKRDSGKPDSDKVEPEKPKPQSSSSDPPRSTPS